MMAVSDLAGRCRSEDGFTLVETLIALMILAISSGLFVQSVALATGQIRTSALAQSAELLAVSIMAERAARGANNPGAEGIDPASGLYWRLVQERRPRVIDEVERASAALVFIEVRAAKNTAPLYELRSVSMEPHTQ
jgi:prepilin-type N-terminal cleavage/methylation domain-containing protein